MNELRNNLFIVFKVVRNIYSWLFFVVHSLILILSQTTLWFGLKDIEYTGEFRDFNTPMFKLLFSISALATQAWIVHEFFIGQNNSGLNLAASFGLLKSKAKVAHGDNSNKKRKNAGV